MSSIEPSAVPSGSEFDARGWLKLLQRFMTKVDGEGLEAALLGYGLELTMVELPLTHEFEHDRKYQQSIIELANALDQFQFYETCVIDKYVRDFGENKEN